MACQHDQQVKVLATLDTKFSMDIVCSPAATYILSPVVKLKLKMSENKCIKVMKKLPLHSKL